ncbi:MAG: DUF1330 domain-containing protein [Rhizobiaceae bacterium]
MRIFIICLIFFATLAPAHSQAVYFVSLAWIKPDGQAQYEAFLEQVQPIWARHNMEVLTRTRVVDLLAGADQTIPPVEIAVLRAASQQDFRAYISDPQYQAIKALRLEAVDRMIVLEGAAKDEPQLNFIRSAPQFAVILGNSETPSMRPLLDIAVSLQGAIKGEVSPPFNTVVSVALLALSFDDNPLSFLEELGPQNQVYVAAVLP